MDTNDFFFEVKKLTDEELVTAFCKKEFSEEFLNAVEEELAIRGYDPSKITSLEEASEIVLQQKTDVEIVKLLNSRKNTFFSPDLLQQAATDRGLSEDSFRDQVAAKGSIGLLIGLPLFGSVVMPVLGVLIDGKPKSGSVLTLVALVLAIYYLAVRQKLPSGKKIWKYRDKTQNSTLLHFVANIGKYFDSRDSFKFVGLLKINKP